MSRAFAKAVLVGVCIVSGAFADNLKLDDILSRAGDVKLEATLTHTLSTYQTPNIGYALTQDSGGDYVQYLANIGNANHETERVTGTLGVRYGLLDALELGLYTAYWVQDVRRGVNGTFDTNITQDFSLVRLALTWEVAKESDLPALLVGLSTNLIDNTYIGDEHNYSYLSDYTLYATTYFSVDPLLFLVQASFGFSLDKTIDAKTYQSPKYLVLSPQVYFSINPYSSLNMGISYTHTRKALYDGVAISNISSQVAYLFGYSFAPDEHSTILFDAQFGVQANYAQSVVSMKYIYNF